LPPDKAQVVREAIFMTPIPPFGYYKAIWHAVQGFIIEPASHWFRSSEPEAFAEDYAAFSEGLEARLTPRLNAAIAPIYAAAFGVAVKYFNGFQEAGKHLVSRLH